MAATTVAACAAAVALRALWWEPRHLAVPEHDVALPGWPPELDGFRVALVSDLHAGGSAVDPNRVVAAVRRARPDLVALLGDYMDARHFSDPWTIAAQLAPLGEVAPVVAVLGNHDWASGGGRMASALRDLGIPVLENQARRVGGVWVAGMGDFSTRDPRVGAALADVPAGEPILVLSHDPDVFPYIPARVALTLSGHTHGGQVDLPWLRRWAMGSRYGERYKEGLVVEGGRHLFVTRGVGTSRLPVRLLAAAEIPVLRLVGSGICRS